MRGKTGDEVKSELAAAGLDEAAIKVLRTHKIFPGNRPTNTLIYRKLTPRTLGRLIALYEHKVFVQGAIWDVNSYDQWGVELGKQLAKVILPELTDLTELPRSEGTQAHDDSTQRLITLLRQSEHADESNDLDDVAPSPPASAA
jgi:glucose-6-phosphate isomerase